MTLSPNRLFFRGSHISPTNRVGLFHLNTRRADRKFINEAIDDVRFNIGEERKILQQKGQQAQSTTTNAHKSAFIKIKEMFSHLTGKADDKQEQEKEQKQTRNNKF